MAAKRIAGAGRSAKLLRINVDQHVLRIGPGKVLTG
jgi:hypothetical protein